MLNKRMFEEAEKRGRYIPKYRICGGTFLYVVLLAISDKAKRRGINNGGVKESSCFTELIRIGNKKDVVGEERTIAQETSKYKYCKIEPTSWMSFVSKDYIDSFNDRMKNDYPAILQETIAWANKYLDLNQHGDWLAKAILELFLFDNEVDQETSKIYGGEDGKLLTLDEVYNLKEIRIQPLILGAWHYIVNHRVNNCVGYETINVISDNNVEPGAIRARRSGIGNSGLLNFKVLIIQTKRKTTDDSSLPELLVEAAEVLSESISEERARESGGIPSKQLMNETIALSNTAFRSYLNNLKDAYRTVKTLLFRQEPRVFEDIYLANDIETPRVYQYHMFGGFHGVGREKGIIKNATVESISEITNYIIISGTGGLGKSMMMRHLLLDAIDNFSKYKLLPFFIPLKDYSADYKSLFEFIYEIYDSFEGNRNYGNPRYSYSGRDPMYELSEVMESGRCLFLLDGLDEIKAVDKPIFEKQLEKLVNGYKKNIFIISSRPYTNYIKFGRFTKLDLLPFSKDQSVALLNKLDMGQENVLKERFIKQFEESFYDDHKEFAENPLLLTIMLLTYRSHANIPVKMHSFYSRAYSTLFTEHDANKIGYRREYKTNLSQEKFAEYFDEFCFLSYQEGIIDLTAEQCAAFFSDLEVVIEELPEFTWKDFMDDLTDSVCLMYEEGQKYHFLHRSFQEYFCARYFYRQEESSLWDIAMFFDDMDVKETDKTFAMLYDMKPKPVENNVFLRFLSEIFGDDEEYEEKYRDFLLKVYPVLVWDEGEVINPSVNKPASYIYSFITSTNNLKMNMDDLEIPYGSKYIETVDEFVYYDPNFEENVVDNEGNIEILEGDSPQLYSAEDVSAEYLLHFSYPEVVGATYKITMNNIFSDVDENSDIIEMLMSDDFPLKKEYEKVHDYYLELRNISLTHKQDLRLKLRKKKT